MAIKTIKKCKIETEADLIRIRREIQIMSSVQHPNIIHIYEGNFRARRDSSGTSIEIVSVNCKQLAPIEIRY